MILPGLLIGLFSFITLLIMFYKKLKEPIQVFEVSDIKLKNITDLRLFHMNNRLLKRLHRHRNNFSQTHNICSENCWYLLPVHAC